MEVRQHARVFRVMIAMCSLKPIAFPSGHTAQYVSVSVQLGVAT